MSKLDKLRSAFGFAFHGIAQAFRSELNLKIHAVISVCVIIAGFLLHISMGEWIAIVLCIALVIAAELINTAIEKLADIIDLKPNKDIGLVKDMAAGAVLWCAMGAVCIGLLIFVPKIIMLF